MRKIRLFFQIEWLLFNSRIIRFAFFISDLRKSLAAAGRQNRRQWKMFKELWSSTKPDTRGALLNEFLFDPAALEARYYHEGVFQSEMKSRWLRDQGYKD